MTSEPPLKKKRPSERGRLRSILMSLPDSQLYEYSYPHPAPLLCLDITTKGFLLSADAKGHVVFWRKKDDDGLELIRSYHCHTTPVVDLHISFDEAYAVTISDEDMSICLFDVDTFELISKTELSYYPSRVAFLPGSISNRILVSDASTPNVHIYNVPFNIPLEPVSTITPLPSPTFAVCCSPISPAIVFTDEFSYFSVWNADTLSPADASLVGWTDIENTEVTKLSIRRMIIEWIAFNKRGDKLAVMTTSGVFVFTFPSLLTIASFSTSLPSLASKTAQEESLLVIPSDDWTMRFEREHKLVEHRPRPSFRVLFDHSGELVVFTTCVGIHICQLDPARLVAVLGKPESKHRFSTFTIYQQNDPVIIAIGINESRLFLFTNREPAEPNPRDPNTIRDKQFEIEAVKGEIPHEVEEKLAMSVQQTTERDSSEIESGFFKVVLKTAEGDVVLSLFPSMASNHFGISVSKKLLDGVVFNRFLDNFILQAPLPNDDGVLASVRSRGKPDVDISRTLGLDFKDPFKLALANSDRDGVVEEWFLTLSPAVHLNGKHFIFGEVVSGTEVLSKLGQDSRILEAEIV
ncbi:hypothetical protein P9112_007408 [Eukaryota sp. TZLM1-RC]